MKIINQKLKSNHVYHWVLKNTIFANCDISLPLSSSPVVDPCCYRSQVNVDPECLLNWIGFLCVSLFSDFIQSRIICLPGYWLPTTPIGKDLLSDTTLIIKKKWANVNCDSLSNVAMFRVIINYSRQWGFVRRCEFSSRRWDTHWILGP